MEKYQIWNLIYINLILWFVLYQVILINAESIDKKEIVLSNSTFIFFIITFMTIIIGCMPISWNFYPSDRYVYADQFNQYRRYGISDFKTNDKGFEFYQKITSKILTAQGWFALTGFIYVLNHYLFVKKIFSDQISIFLIAVFSSMFFYAYGTNTIRSGLAASFFILSFAYGNKSINKYIFLAISISLHLSFVIPLMAYIIANIYRNTHLYVTIWIISVFISYFLPDYFSPFLSNFLNIDDRAVSYIMSDSVDAYRKEFRLDFLLYSSVPIFIGLFFINKKSIQSKFYNLLLNTYIISNTFWVLNIRAIYSDRFAYLSWFILPILIIYPFLYSSNIRNKKIKISFILLINVAFTYLMSIREII